MPLKVGFDIDGVLADFKSGFRAVAQELIPGTASQPSAALSPADITRVWERIARIPNWWATLKPYEPAEIRRLYDSVRAHRWELVFVTNRPPSGGDTVQLQTQWWLEQYGFLMPAVITVPGSRGDVANALRLDLMIDDQAVNCAEVVGGSTTKALLLLREETEAARQHALSRGIGVVNTLAQAIDIVEQLRETLPKRRGRMMRLADWFSPAAAPATPLDPSQPRPAITGAESTSPDQPNPAGNHARNI